MTDQDYDGVLKFMADRFQNSLPFNADKIVEKSGLPLTKHEVFSILGKLERDGYATRTTANFFGIKAEGIEFINSGGYTARRKKTNDSAELADRKLRVDLKNAERVYKSYPTTRIIAWGGFIAGVFLLLLRLAEALKLWPYHK